MTLNACPLCGYPYNAPENQTYGKCKGWLGGGAAGGAVAVTAPVAPRSLVPRSAAEAACYLPVLAGVLLGWPNPIGAAFGLLMGALMIKVVRLDMERFSKGLLLGMVAGLTRAIPVVGPVFGAIPIVGLALLQSPGTAVTVLVFFVVLQLVESKFILPQVIGHELNLHAATILLALLVGDALFGLMGMFLAAPAAAFLKEMRALAEQRVVAPGDTPAG